MDPQETSDRARGLVTAEAIIAGFLFTTAAIQQQALRVLWTAQSPQFPVSTFGVTIINYALIVIAFRCIWLSLRALGQSNAKSYRVSYHLFVVVLLATIATNVLPAIYSISRITLTHNVDPQLLPYELQLAFVWVYGELLVVGGCTALAFFRPVWVDKNVLSPIWNWLKDP